MGNIDVTATFELLIAIAIVFGFVAVFYNRKYAPKVIATETVEVAPYKVEAPVIVEKAMLETSEPVAPEVKEPKPKKTTARKDSVKKPAAKKTVAKKTTAKKTAAK
jgi:hypothetical protein